MLTILIRNCSGFLRSAKNFSCISAKSCSLYLRSKTQPWGQSEPHFVLARKPWLERSRKDEIQVLAKIRPLVIAKVTGDFSIDQDSALGFTLASCSVTPDNKAWIISVLCSSS